MGCTNAKVDEPLSEKLRAKAIEIFKKLDIKGNGTIDKQGTEQFWKSNFAKLNTEALFEAVDFDKSGDITEDEWMAFWEIVKQNGYSEEEINIELDELMEGKAWVQFKRVDRFLKIDEKRRGSRVKSIVQEEKRKLSIIQSARLHKSKTMQSEGQELLSIKFELLKKRSLQQYYKSNKNNLDYINNTHQILLQTVIYLSFHSNVK